MKSLGEASAARFSLFLGSCYVSLTLANTETEEEKKRRTKFEPNLTDTTPFSLQFHHSGVQRKTKKEIFWHCWSCFGNQSSDGVNQIQSLKAQGSNLLIFLSEKSNKRHKWHKALKILQQSGAAAHAVKSGCLLPAPGSSRNLGSAWHCTTQSHFYQLLISIE